VLSLAVWLSAWARWSVEDVEEMEVVLSTGLVGGGKSGWWRSTAGSVAWCKYRWERKRRSDGMRKRSGDRLQLLCPRVRAWGGGGMVAAHVGQRRERHRDGGAVRMGAGRGRCF
jgi:hypothetical protein